MTCPSLWAACGCEFFKVLDAVGLSWLTCLRSFTLKLGTVPLVIEEGLSVEPVFFHIKSSQTRWFRPFTMPSGCLLSRIFRAGYLGHVLLGVGLEGPRTLWIDYISLLPWECLSAHPEKLDDVAKEKEIWAFLLRLPPWMDGWMIPT